MGLNYAVYLKVCDILNIFQMYSLYNKLRPSVFNSIKVVVNSPLIILNFPISCLINSKCGKKLIYEGFRSELFQTFKLWPLKVFFEKLKKLSPPKLNHILGKGRQQKLWLGIVFNPTAQFFVISKNRGVRAKLKIWLLIWNRIKVKLTFSAFFSPKYGLV